MAYPRRLTRTVVSSVCPPFFGSGLVDGLEFVGFDFVDPPLGHGARHPQLSYCADGWPQAPFHGLEARLGDDRLASDRWAPVAFNWRLDFADLSAPVWAPLASLGVSSLSWARRPRFNGPGVPVQVWLPPRSQTASEERFRRFIFVDLDSSVSFSAPALAWWRYRAGAGLVLWP